MSDAHPGVDAYIDSLPAWQQDICRDLREIIRAAHPGITETVKRSDQPYFVSDDNVCAILAARDHINLFLYDPTVPDPEGVINQGHGNATARAVQIYEGQTINRNAIGGIVRAIADRNKLGGWRRLG